MEIESAEEEGAFTDDESSSAGEEEDDSAIMSDNEDQENQAPSFPRLGPDGEPLIEPVSPLRGATG